ncbi:MAG: fimbrillin family protein [Bacteroidales bacterium]|nr:fimbrillin family protein [Bacteroidales bacterium]
MKTICHFIAPLLVIITMVACAELEVSENAQSSNNELLQELSITGKDFIFDGETRSAVTIGDGGASFTWDEDDVIGIFPDKGDQVSFAMDEGAGTQTATFSGGGWALKSSAKYAAYYPHVYDNRDLTAIPVSYVGQAQNGNANTDHIGAYDFMAAGVSTPENGAVAFDMQHLGALVQLTITVPEPSALTKVVLSSSTEFTETGTIDLTADTPAITAVTQSNTLEIALNNVTTTEANEKVIVYFMMAPVDLTDSELTATIYFDDETTSNASLIGKKIDAGNAYRLIAEVNLLRNYIDEYDVNRGPGVEIDGVVWAPVNCGYHETDYKYGKLYQWGRRYGQGYNGFFYGGALGQTYSDISSPTIVSGPVSLSIYQSESNSDKFYKSDYVSVNPQNDALWNSGTESTPVKTEYDPCPKGWRVPTYSEMNNLISNYSSWTTNEGQHGYWFSGSKAYSTSVSRVFFPASGNIRGYDAYADSRDGSGSYWSSRPDKKYAYLLYFLDTNVLICSDNYQASGLSIRCVQE